MSLAYISLSLSASPLSTLQEYLLWWETSFVSISDAISGNMHEID